MHPRLHSEALFPTSSVDPTLQIESSFIGSLEKVVSCTVTEERNGEYTLDMQLAVTDDLANAVIPQRWICAKPNPTDSDQFFKIMSVSRNISSPTISIQAKHVKTIAFNRACVGGDISTSSGGTSTYRSGTPLHLWQILKREYLVTSWNDIFPYSFVAQTSPTDDTDPFTSKKLNIGINDACTLGEVLGGANGSFLDLFNGEFQFDNLNINFYQERGVERAYQIRYGQNLSSATQQLTCDNTFSHILTVGYAPALDSNENRIKMRLHGINPDVPGLTGAVPVTYFLPSGTQTDAVFSEAKTYIYDVSNYLESENPIHYQNEYEKRNMQLYMGELTEMFVKKSLIPYITTDIQIDTRAELDEMNQFSLCDTVTVVLDKFGVTTKAKITKTVYNPILERYEKLVIGKETMKLADIIMKKNR